MQQNNQQIYPYQTDEIDLRKLFNSLLARKFFIFGLTGFVTLLAIIYALNLPPTYKVVSSFTSPSDSSILNINKLELTTETKDSITETKDSIFTNFLTIMIKNFYTIIFWRIMTCRYHYSTTQIPFFD